MAQNSLVLPRPGTKGPSHTQKPIRAPSEALFTSTFGNLLPKASYLETPNGRAAYYSLPPVSISSSAPAPGNPIQRVLFVHGVQTSAIGLQPLATTLSARFPSAHCVLLDLWGHGLSDTPILAHTSELFHDLLLALMDRLEWPDAHFVGYSFGGSTTASFTARHSERVLSIVLVAPAGLVRAAQLGELERRYMHGGEGLEDQAREWVFEWLEGGKLIVPVDWKERVERGEVVAEAVRDWEVREHGGHVASVVGIVRDGGVFDRDAEFAEAAKKGIPNLCILGELDDLCSVRDLAAVGMQNVSVIPQVGHGVVREKVSDVTCLIEDFWNAG
ncbi:hypothetical protein N7517_007597 [Penicillium concentricum]|uniref:AB hydrolase-1 domain-containing protein n=1 Tax=Penicillium concentricum TaxID=293559 RepID=A0A9W9SBH5_9EURO|nr:uncharacterized protein N7517_007597 [Penicillium concentricum]KAJ5375591.1 hypothetical protein N7517_007597 [Penicillium concentricum]